MRHGQWDCYFIKQRNKLRVNVPKRVERRKNVRLSQSDTRTEKQRRQCQTKVETPSDSKKNLLTDKSKIQNLLLDFAIN